MRTAAKFVLLSLACTLVASARGALGEEERTQAGARPDPAGRPTKLAIGIYVIDIVGINGAAQNYTANVFLYMQWKDVRLANESNGVRSLRLNDVWNPRMLILNQQRLWKSFDDIVEVEPDGTVTYRQRYFGEFSNPLDLSDFPLDRHVFQIHVVTPGYGPEEVEFVTDPRVEEVSMASRLSIPDWQITPRSQHPEPFEPAPGEKLSGFMYEFEAERLLGFYVVKVFMPLVLIVFMSWTVFWIDPAQVGSQISVSVTSMLTLIAYRFALGTLLPRVSYLNRMDYFMIGSTFLVFLALLEVALTSRLAISSKTKLARRIDNWCRLTFPAAFLILMVFAFWF